MSQTINRHGDCPNCGINWDGGDILQVLKKMDAFIHTSEDTIKKIAYNSYGYTEQNKWRFSRTITITKETNSYCQCPDCMVIWNINTGEQLKSFLDIY